MTAPQIIYGVLIGVGLGCDLARDGNPKEGNHSFALSLFSSAISVAILWWGGFWK